MSRGSVASKARSVETRVSIFNKRSKILPSVALRKRLLVASTRVFAPSALISPIGSGSLVKRLLSSELIWFCFVTNKATASAKSLHLDNL